MDGAASVIAVASIAIQLADSMKKLSEFWASIKEAPQDVQNIIIDLDLLTDVLCEIALEAQQSPFDGTLAAALRSCQSNTNILVTILNELQPGFASAKRVIRKWTAIKSILKREKVKKFQATLDRLKSTLMLVRQNQISRSTRLQLQAQQKLFTVMEKHMSRLCIEGTSGEYCSASKWMSLDQSRSTDCVNTTISTLKTVPNYTGVQRRTNNEVGAFAEPDDGLAFQGKLFANLEQPQLTSEEIMLSRRQTGFSASNLWRKRWLYGDYVLKESFFGSVRITSTARSLYFTAEESELLYISNDQQREDEICIDIRPAPWLRYLGIIHGLSMRLLDSSLHGWNYTLSSFRPVPCEAPIFQFCEDGNLPAVRQLLLDGDASVKDVNIDGLTPLHFAARSHNVELCKYLIASGADRSTRAFRWNESPLQWAIEPIPTCDEELGWIDTSRLFLDCLDLSIEEDWHLLYSAMTFSPSATFRSWFLGQMTSKMKDNFSSPWYACTLATGHLSMNLEEMRLWLNYGPERAIESTDVRGYTALFAAVADGRQDMSILLKNGADPHCLCVFQGTSRQESPSSIAVFSSAALRSWQCSLRRARMDIEALIRREVHEGAMSELGWTTESLQKLFDWNFAATNRVSHCSDCANGLLIIPVVQPFWLKSLEEIRCGKEPQESSWHFPLLVQDNLCARKDDSALDFLQDEPPTDATMSDNDTAPPLDHLDEDTGIKGSSFNESYSRPRDSICPYQRDELVCMKCWLYFCRTGTRPDSETQNCSSDEGDASDEEYSPFHIHS